MDVADAANDVFKVACGGVSSDSINHHLKSRHRKQVSNIESDLSGFAYSMTSNS
jgi:hypothetical protein